VPAQRVPVAEFASWFDMTDALGFGRKGRFGRQVTNQVTMTPGDLRPSATRSDTDIGLACGNLTWRDVIRRIRYAG